MKYRIGFVSNSSTISFVCGVCNEQFAGMDLCPGDVDHQRCENGHIFCIDQMVNRDRFNHLQELYYENVDAGLIPAEADYAEYNTPEFYNRYGLYDEASYECPEEFCPVCQMQYIDPSELVEYLYAKLGLDKKQLIDEIKGRFKSYEEFQAFLAGE